MKILCNIIIVASSFIFIVLSQAQQISSAISSVPTTPQPAIVARDANSRVWQWIENDEGPNGQTVQRTHSFTELASGLCYGQNGQWMDSQEQINILPDGSAEAIQGEHQVYFPAGIYNGVITLVTPDGLQLKSQPIGLSYDDGTNTVLIGELTNSIGQLIASNQVVYTNAFTGVDADLLYTYRKGGFEQDVIFREQPPEPEQFGLSSASARLQMLTEFFSPPAPVEYVGPVNPQDGLQDTTLTFGAMKMVQGKAFLMNTINPRDNQGQIPVYKSLATVDGRTVLIEQVPYQRISAQLATLPSPPATGATTANLTKASPKRWLPPARFAQVTTNSMRLAKSDLKQKSGVVFDYVTINSGETNYTFHGDTTYYVSGEYDLSGTTVIEGSAIIKMANGGELDIDDSDGDPNATISCETAPYRPAIFTSVNDDTIGEPIWNISSGSPSYQDVGAFLVMNDSTNIALHDVRFSYSLSAIDQNAYPSSVTIRDCQFDHEHHRQLEHDRGRRHHDPRWERQHRRRQSRLGFG